MKEMNIHIKLKRQKEKQSEEFYKCDAVDSCSRGQLYFALDRVL